jgi:hypothetical protein
MISCTRMCIQPIFLKKKKKKKKTRKRVSYLSFALPEHLLECIIKVPFGSVESKKKSKWGSLQSLATIGLALDSREKCRVIRRVDRDLIRSKSNQELLNRTCEAAETSPFGSHCMTCRCLWLTKSSAWLDLRIVPDHWGGYLCRPYIYNSIESSERRQHRIFHTMF